VFICFSFLGTFLRQESGYYYELLDIESKEMYIQNCLKCGSFISKDILHVLSSDEKDKIIRKGLLNRNRIPEYYFKETDDYDLKMEIIRATYKTIDGLTVDNLEWLKDNNREFLTHYLEENIYYLHKGMLKYLNNEQFKRFLIDKKKDFSSHDYWCDLSHYLTYEQKIEYIKFLIKNDYDYVFNYDSNLKTIAKENNLI
jgi:hypothetical protein